MKNKILILLAFLIFLMIVFVIGMVFGVEFLQKETPKDTIKPSSHSKTYYYDTGYTLSFTFDKDFPDSNGHLFRLEWKIKFISQDSIRWQLDSTDSWNCRHPSHKSEGTNQTPPAKFKYQRRKKESKHQDLPVYQVSEENDINYTPIQKEVIAKYYRGEKLDFVEGEIFWDLLREQYDR